MLQPQEPPRCGDENVANRWSRDAFIGFPDAGASGYYPNP
jgi:hypothetical protein